jgi:hypothetical protein
LYRRLGGPQGRSGHVRKISPPPGFDLRTLQPVAYIKTIKNNFSVQWSYDTMLQTPREKTMSYIKEFVKKELDRTEIKWEH